MSTTLTNGIIIPDNGSRNWGGDLANNWNILDVHVGYMTDVKNRVTTLENSVAENTANIQTNASNISTLQTIKQDVIEDIETIRNGASAGATAVQPSTLNNYVDLSSEQTIVGKKTFSNGIYSGFIEFNPIAGSNHGGFIDFHHNGSAKDYTSRIIENIEGNLDINGCRVSYTAVYCSDNTCDLGTSTNRWKTINGINPGALSLPNYSQSVSISFAVETPISIPIDGFLSIALNVENNSYFSVFVNSEEVYVVQSALKPTVGAFIPVSANDIVKIHVADGMYTGYGKLVLYKNKGNI